MNGIRFAKAVLHRLGMLYVRMLCKREFRSQHFSNINERPVEYEFLFRQLTKKFPRTVLDVGSGLTALPHVMSSCGFVVTAVDNIRDYWDHDAINRHFYIINDDITNTRLTERFDFISCISVLEHIKNYNSAVKSMFSLLNPGGHLVLTFPYNEKNYTENVYKLPGSSVKEDYSFITQAYSRKELDMWMSENDGKILEQEYWRFYTGEFWTLGEMVSPPVQVNNHEAHQISCVLIQKEQRQ